MNRETTALFLLYMRVFGKPVLKTRNVDELITTNLSSAMRFEVTCSQYRKIASIFATFVAMKTRGESLDQAQHRETLRQMFELQLGHSIATNRGKFYANLDSAAWLAPLVSSAWRSFVCLLPSETPGGRSNWRLELTNCQRPLLPDLITLITSGLSDDDHKQEMQKFVSACCDLSVREIFAYHSCGFGKLCGPAAVAQFYARSKPFGFLSAREHHGLSPRVVVVVGTQELAFAHCTSFIVKLLGVTAAAWSQRPGEGGPDPTASLVFVCHESIPLPAFQQWYNGGQFISASFIDEVRQPFPSHLILIMHVNCAWFL